VDDAAIRLAILGTAQWLAEFLFGGLMHFPNVVRPDVPMLDAAGDRALEQCGLLLRVLLL
jgi:hypothetical protein